MENICYKKHICFSYHIPDNRFSLLFITIFHFLHNKKPVELQFYGFLTFEYNAILR